MGVRRSGGEAVGGLRGLDVRGTLLALQVAALVFGLSSAVFGEVRLVRINHDPFGLPRPAPDSQAVPLRTSFCFQLMLTEGSPEDSLDADAVTMTLTPEGGNPIALLREGQRLAPGCSGNISSSGRGKEARLTVYLDPGVRLAALTRHVVQVTARSAKGVELAAGEGSWSFTTEAGPRVRAVSYRLDVGQPSVRWHGAFFSGVCQPGVNPDLRPGYEMMRAVHARWPKAWSLQRTGGITGFSFQPSWIWDPGNPNIVRELETRRISAMETTAEGVRLSAEDFFGHEQYGIPSGRPVSADYHPGEEVLIADGVSSARTQVVSADDKTGSVVVKAFDTPAGGWKTAYSAPLPTREDPNTPGLFPPGGCYLRKFKPTGTPRYYWGRLDKEYDLVHGHLGRRIVVNFLDGPGDLSLDGCGEKTAKDYAEYQEVVREIAGHIIERYGAACLDFYWSVFNEPDLSSYWRLGEGWNEAQRFYDYTVDGVLRAFEDHGYDSKRVIVGGLELGAIFGTGLRLGEFLGHCSPRATRPGALAYNAAYQDARLEGKRSRRVEELCGAHGGKGSPCDFISIHSYNSSEMMAAKLTRAKEMALEVDPGYYEKLIITSYECCPNWSPPPDRAAHDSYLGSGYFSTWCADVARRLLQKAAEDRRYAYGEQVITRWPFPIGNFRGLNEVIFPVEVDDNGDGLPDRKVTIPWPVFHFLGLLNSMGEDYWVLPERVVGGHVVSGFVTKTEKELRLLVYSHDRYDSQCRSGASFEVTLELSGLGWPEARVEEYRFDKDHNSFFRLAERLSERGAAPGGPRGYSPGEIREVEKRAKLEVTRSSTRAAEAGGELRLGVRVSGNGANFVVISAVGSQ